MAALLKITENIFENYQKKTSIYYICYMAIMGYVLQQLIPIAFINKLKLISKEFETVMKYLIFLGILIFILYAILRIVNKCGKNSEKNMFNNLAILESFILEILIEFRVYFYALNVLNYFFNLIILNKGFTDLILFKKILIVVTGICIVIELFLEQIYTKYFKTKGPKKKKSDFIILEKDGYILTTNRIKGNSKYKLFENQKLLIETNEFSEIKAFFDIAKWA